MAMDQHVDVFVEPERRPWKRISWGAILAGTVVALVLQLWFGVLGLALGAYSISPSEGMAEAREFAIGTGIWFLITGIISVMAGGWIAGRMAGIPRRLDATLHGVITWALVTIIGFMLLTSAVGQIIGGTMNALQSGVSAVARGGGQILSTAANSVDVRADVNEIRREAYTVLRQTDDPTLQPEAIERDVENILSGVNEGDIGLDEALNRVFNRAERVANNVDKQDLASVIAARTGMTQDEAMQRVNKWDSRITNAWDQTQSTVGEAAQTMQERAPEYAERAADYVGTAALWVAITMFLGLLAAGAGGGWGAPKRAFEEETGRPNKVG